MKSPVVSVVMAVHNGQEYLNIAVDSILLQSYKNLELIIVDDGSTDDSKSIIEFYKDPRVKYYYQKNKGLAAALNAGVAESSGSYIARMDADDISEPNRIKAQVSFLDKNPDIALVGTSFNIIDENGAYLGKSYHLTRTEDIELEMFTRNPFGHGTVMVRKSALDDVGKYDENQPIEDYDLWWRILQRYKASNIPEELYSWRVVSGSISHGSSQRRQKQIRELIRKIWTESKPRNVPLGQIRSGLLHYEKLGDGYSEQYKYMLAALCLGSYRMRSRLFASTLSSKLLLADPGFRLVLQDLRRNPLSHNYLVKLMRKH